MLKEALYYSRMAWHFGRFLRMPPVRDPQALLRHHLEHRDENFLALVHRGVFENPRSPYHHLMRLAGCTFGDLGESVRRSGLEATLEKLRQNGVYLTHAEAKGAPVERHHRVIANDPAATANPGCSHGIESISGGSRSVGTATPTSNTYRHYRAAYDAVLREDLGVKGAAFVSLQPILPAPQGLVNSALASMHGLTVERWFAAGGAPGEGLPYRVVTHLMVLEARLLGCRLQHPTYLERDDFSPVAQWIAETRRQGRCVWVRGNVSSSTRVCAAARDGAYDIAGTIFIASGEGLTEAKRGVIESAGARACPLYVASEVGTIGMACRHVTGNSVHLFSDSVAVISHRRPAKFSDVEVDSLLFTSLNPFASRVLINAELDDAGTIEPATCDCAFTRAGYRTVIRDVHSFGKLTGHGLSLAGTQLVSLLEDRLPARFGGVPGDYQLVEIEGADQTEVRLCVSPRVGAVDPQSVHAFFMTEIRTVYGGAISRRIWEQTSSLKVEIVEPYRTRTGKVHPLHLPRFRGRNAH